MHKKDLSPIHYSRVCDKEEKQVSWGDIVKGYQLESGRFVVLDEKDFETANIKRVKSLEILDFVAREEIDSVFYEKPYFLEPQRGAAKAYLLLREALLEMKMVGVVKFVLHNREHLGVIRPYKDILVLNQLRFVSELRSPAIDLPKMALSKREIGMAKKLIDQLTVKFNPKHYKDEYREELLAVIKRKAKGRAPKAKGKLPKKTVRSDLTKILRASLRHKKAPHMRGA